MAPIITALQAFSDPATCQLPPGEERSEFSVLGQISKYLKVVPIEGKGLGVIATQDIKPFTLLLSEAPAAVCRSEFDIAKDAASVLEAVGEMSPMIRAKFDALYEAPIGLEPRELRIWATNSLSWKCKDKEDKEDKEDKVDEVHYLAVCIRMSRVNHSCLPNSIARPDRTREHQHLTSTRAIRAGEEVTISYHDEAFYYRTAEESNAFLKHTHSFACKCPACTGLAPVSDRRRQMLKQIFFCKIYSSPAAPDFPPVSSYEDYVSALVEYDLVDNSEHPAGPAGSLDVSAFRQTAKLEWDEGLVTIDLIARIFSSTWMFLISIIRRKVAGMPLEPFEDPNGNRFQRNLFLMFVCDSLLCKLQPSDDKEQLLRMVQKTMVFEHIDVTLKFDKLIEPSDHLTIIAAFMSKEPDPFAEGAYPSQTLRDSVIWSSS